MADFISRLFRGNEKPADRKKTETAEKVLAQMEAHILALRGLPSTRARKKTIEKLEKIRQKIQTHQEEIAHAQQLKRLSKLPIRPSKPTNQLPLEEMALHTGWNVRRAQADTAIRNATREARKVITTSRLKTLQAHRRAQRGK